MQVKDAKFGTKISNEKLLNATKSQCYIILLFLRYYGKTNMGAKIPPTHNHFYNILRLFDVLPIFPFTTSETCAIITYKHGIYALPHELPNDLGL